MNSNGCDYDLIILGGGPAGLTAGLYAMRAVLKTALIEMATPGGQVAITKGVENYPGFEDISGLDLSDKLLHHAQSYGLEVIQDEAVSIDPGLDFHSVRFSSGKSLKAHAVIIATGGNPRKLGIAGRNRVFGQRRLLLRKMRWLLFPGQGCHNCRWRGYGARRGALSCKACLKSLPGPPPGHFQSKQNTSEKGP